MGFSHFANPNPPRLDKVSMNNNENPKRAERKRLFALKNERRKEARKRGRATVLANREMGRLLSQKLWRRGQQPES